MLNAAERWLDAAATAEKAIALLWLKATADSKAAWRYREAEIVTFLRENHPDMRSISAKYLQQLSDVDTVKVLLAFNGWKEAQRRKGADSARGK